MRKATERICVCVWMIYLYDKQIIIIIINLFDDVLFGFTSFDFIVRLWFFWRWKLSHIDSSHLRTLGYCRCCYWRRQRCPDAVPLNARIRTVWSIVCIAIRTGFQPHYFRLWIGNNIGKHTAVGDRVETQTRPSNVPPIPLPRYKNKCIVHDVWKVLFVNLLTNNGKREIYEMPNGNRYILILYAAQVR